MEEDVKSQERIRSYSVRKWTEKYSNQLYKVTVH